MDGSKITVTENYDTMVVTVSCPDKRIDPLQIRRCNKWGHFNIQTVTGVRPRELDGTFTNSTQAIEVVKRFLEKSPKTSSVKRKEIRESKKDGPVI